MTIEIRSPDQATMKLSGGKETPNTVDTSVLLKDAFDSAIYAGLAQPAIALAQSVDNLTGWHTADKLVFRPPEEAPFGSTRWHAQTIGGALGAMIPLIVSRKAAKSLCGTRLPWNASFASLRTTMGLSIKEAALTGFIADSMFKPSMAVPSTKEDAAERLTDLGMGRPETLDWSLGRQRLKQGMGGALTFAAMTSTGLGAARLAATTLLRNTATGALLRHPVGNGIISGIPGGAIAAEYESLIHARRFATMQEAGTSIYTMSLVGGMFAMKHQLFDRKKSAFQAAAAFPKPHFNCLFGPYSSEMGMKPGNCGKADLRTKGGRQQGGGEGKSYSNQEVKIQHIENPESKNTLNQFSETILRKFNRQPMSEHELKRIIEGLPESDRKLGLSILEKSLPNSSEVLFAERLKSLSKNVEAAFTNGLPIECIATGQASWSKAFSYLFRKLSPRGHARNIDDLKESSQCLLFDNPDTTNYSSQQLSKLKSLQRLVIADIGSFEKGINFIDYALGKEHVQKKLTGLVREIKQEAGQDTAHQEHIADSIIRGTMANSAAKLNANNLVITPDEGAARNRILSLAPHLSATSSPAQRLADIHKVLSMPRVDAAELSRFLSSFVPSNREPAAYVLAEGSRVFTYADMVALSRQLHKKLLDCLAKENITPDRTIFHQGRGGDSVDLVNYIYTS
ncbi:MAG TPA: hypothetical protein V6D17_16560 [Candidatus Obscuribacterales bacterium]